MIDIYDLLLLTFFCGIALWWWHIMGQKQRVLGFIQQHCEQRGYQLLDQTLGFSRYRFIRDGLNRRHLCRVYSFDFSNDGVNRWDGEVAIKGQTIVQIILDTEETEISDLP